MICVLDSPPGKSKLEVMHYVEKAHKSSITCCACSPPPQFADVQTTRFVATGDETGGVQVYDLRRITFLFRCASVHTHEIRALHFPTALSGFLLSGDASGAIFGWQTIGVRSSTIQPLVRLRMQELTPSKPLQSRVDFDGIISMCSTNIRQEERLATHPELLYVGLETGQIFAWDLRSLSGKIQLEPTRRSAVLRRRSSDSREKVLPAFESGSSTLPVVVSTKSWMAHVAGVLSIQSVYWPGEFLSLGADGIVKIWDHTAACMGHILTIGEQSATSASAWKYVRHDHTMGSEQKELLERIAREVIAKHQRRLQKEQKRQRKSPQSSDNSLATPSSLLELDLPVSLPQSPPSPGNCLFPDAPTAMTNAATALIMQVPFSVTSVTSGMQHGIFGPEEAQHLRSIAKNSKALVADVSDKRKRVAALAPLFSSPEEMGRARAKAKAKARALMNNPMNLDLHSAGARILTNYPLEIERRAAAAAKLAVGAARALDVEPSQFLREKLPGAASPMVKAVKSTPKKRLQPAIDIKMDASVVILAKNVSLPKLTQPQESEEVLRTCQALSSCASAPGLTSPATLEPPASPEKLRCNSNVERKLKLCQKIVANVCLMSSKPKILKEEVEKEKIDSPTSKIWQKASTLPITPGKNPFGPHYTVKQVEQLAVGLARLDEDGSGDLSQHEWTQLVAFCGLGSTSSRNTASSVDSLFHSIDKDSSGTISLRELLPTLVR
ncbi:hypothetical protein DVH05_020187 [Phytophthora capsici]|nr:hypothetical protein DVH05_020187 [Phytophthora capsici]